MRKAKRHTRDELGAAVVEFAITTGVLALLLMWSHFFFDIIQIRMKVLEASRTAMWEFTAYPMTDYDKGTQSDHDAKFDAAKDEIEKDVKDLYETDLDSSNKYKQNKTAIKRLTIDTLTVDDVRLSNGTPYTMQFLDILQTILHSTPYKSFNQKGLISAEAKAEMTSSWVPTQIQFGKEYRTTPLHKRLAQKLYMLVDSWKLEDGCSVEAPGDYASGGTGACQGKTGESTFKKEVGNIAYYGFDTSQYSFSTGSGYGLSTDLLNPFTVRVSSTQFVDAPGGTADGRQTLKVSGGEDKFYTTAFCNVASADSTNCSGEYRTAFEKRGQYFMGCPKEQYDGKELCPWDKQQPNPGP